MAVPQYVFLDTNVFTGQAYNFDSTALKTFVAAAKPHGITLVLPDPTEREVKRQIRERANEALAALNEARRKAPFLAKWEHFPKRNVPAVVDLTVSRIALAEWEQFLGQFTLKRLDYKTISVDEVMNWYDNMKAPFGAGKKRKEFPDAFAVAILDRFVFTNSCAVAVVSEDQDIKLACDLRPSLLHFHNLPRLTELLVAGPDKVTALREAILSEQKLLIEALRDEASNLTYYHVSRAYEINESNLEGVSFNDLRIVGLGHGEATLAFEALIETSHALRWQEEDYDDTPVLEDGTFLDSGVIHGIAKVELDPRTGQISSVTYMEIEEPELAVNETPRYR